MDAIPTEIWFFAVIVLMTLIFVVDKLRRGEPITVPAVLNEVRESASLAREVADVAMAGVLAAEQLAESGKITKDDRFQHAYEHIVNWFPDQEIDEDAIVNAIESSVMLLKLGASFLPRQLGQ